MEEVFGSQSEGEVQSRDMTSQVRGDRPSISTDSSSETSLVTGTLLILPATFLSQMNPLSLNYNVSSPKTACLQLNVCDYGLLKPGLQDPP